MEVATLRWFQQIVDGATVTEVSELDMVSQPAVSRALARLAEEVGAPLLRREGRLLRPTRAGATFKYHVDAALHHLDDGLAAVAQLLDPETGVVTVAYQPSLGSWLVPQLAAEFRRRHPQVGLDLRSWTDETTPATGPDADIDVELTTSRRSAQTHHWHPLTREPIRLIASQDHPLAANSPVELTQLAGQPLITMRPTSQLRLFTDALLAEHGVEAEVAFVVDDLPSLYGHVAAGLGVALAPERSHPGVAILPLAAEDAFREVGIAWARDRRFLPSAALFRDYVLDGATSSIAHPQGPISPSA